MRRVGKIMIIVLLLGIVILQVGIIYGRVKWKSKYNEQQSIFQLIESSKDVIYLYEVSKMKFKYISPSIENFLGKGAIVEANENPHAPFERVHPDDYVTLCKKAKGEIDYSQIIIQRWKDNHGNYKWFEEYATPIYENGKLAYVQGIMRNIDEKVKLQQALEYRISHDTLTDIYNREYFEKKFEELDKKVNAPVAIIVCDLDGLKLANDNLGHKAGDALLKRAAELLNQLSSETITVARIGGDEFVLVVTDKSEEQISQLVTQLQNDIKKNNSNDSMFSIEMSIGYSYAPWSLGKMEFLFSQADKNMYEDKMSRKKLFAGNFN
jgi:diguanylate cyclase (GGDEF)-like protein/PAS domain S-box-containing protein